MMSALGEMLDVPIEEKERINNIARTIDHSKGSHNRNSSWMKRS